MKKIRIILVFMLGLLLFGCPVDKEEIDRTLTIINDSDFNIYFHMKFDKAYPEKYLLEWIPNESSFIDSNNSINIPISSEWFDNDKLFRLFIYKSSTLEANDWETIKANGLYDARFDLTLEELEAMNWIVIYTGL